MEANPGSQPATRLAVYRPGTVKMLFFGVFLIVLGLPCSIGGIKISEPATVYETSTSTPGGWLLTVGIALALCGIVILILATGNRKLRVDLYEQGFVATGKQGKKEIRWDQITHIWHKLEEDLSTPSRDPQTTENSPAKTRKVSTDVYEVQCIDGTTWSISTSIYGLSKFAPILEQGSLRYLLPRALENYQNGTPLHFGTLSVSYAGVSNTSNEGNESLSWGSFRALEVEKRKGTITVDRGSEAQLWSTISISDTPDVAVFEALVNKISSDHLSHPQREQA